MWIFKNKFLQTHLPSVDRALLALGQQLSASFAMAVDPIADVAAFSGFAALVSTWPEGVKKYVQTVRDTYTLTRTSAPVATDGITVVAAGPANTYWIRDLIPSSRWGQQATWYVNPGAAGSDESSGVDQAHPIKTYAEWRRRVGDRIRTSMDVHLLGDLPIDDPVELDVEVEEGALLHVIGTTVQTDAGTLTGSTPRNAATNQPNELVDAAPQDWSTRIGDMVTLTASGAICWVMKDLLAGRARVSIPVEINGYQHFDLVEVFPVGNEVYTISRPGRAYGGHGIYVRSPDAPTGTAGMVVIDDLEILQSVDRRAAISCDGMATCRMRRCAIAGDITLTGIQLLGCMFRGSTFGTFLHGYEQPIRIAGCAAFGGLACHGSSQGVNVYSPGGILFQGVGLSVYGKATITGPVAAFDRIDPAHSREGIEIEERGYVRIFGVDGTLYGSGNATYGMRLKSETAFVCDDLSKVTITGVLGDVIIGQSTSLMPDIAVFQGAVLPQVAPCGSWAQVAAAPFFGKVRNYSTGAYIGPTFAPAHDNINWQTQPDFYVDPVAGNDTNVGNDQPHAIRTFAEFKRRVGPKITSSVNVHLVSSLPNTDPLDGFFEIAEGALLHIIGARTQIDNGVLTARTARAPATNTPNDITDATGAGQDWSGLVGRLVHFTVADAWCWVAKNLGANKARVSTPFTITGYSRQSVVEFVPAGNEAYTVESPLQVYTGSGLFFRGTTVDQTAKNTGFAVVDDVEFLLTANDSNSVECDIANCNFRRCIFPSSTTIANAAILLGCELAGSSFLQGATTQVRMVGCLALGSMSVNGAMANGLTIYAPGLMVQGGNLSSYSRIQTSGPLSVFDATGAGISAELHAWVELSGGSAYLYGQGNTTYGANIKNKASIIGAVAKVTIAGAAGQDVLIGGLASLRPDFDDGGVAANMPATAACGTWAQIAAAPFNGRAYNHNNGA